jgi:malonyl-CoA O-methyltransferase
MLVHAGFADPVMDQETLTLQYDSAEALLAELRSLGGNAAPDRFAGLRTPRWRQRLVRELESSLRRGDAMPAFCFVWPAGQGFRAARGRPPAPPTTVSLDDMRAMVRSPRHPARGAGGSGSEPVR